MYSDGKAPGGQSPFITSTRQTLSHRRIALQVQTRIGGAELFSKLLRAVEAEDGEAALAALGKLAA